ncbi:hypothetical protein [Acinetobacter sp. MF4640]|uniref:hypothetical protein n=1 Tax=Acinetobacter sp. MF4640 TaxID=1960826 RepID=UPI000994B87C|nr:hypothetical protein [Acinetobacter sp. MF4640]OOW11980.1 hypothetical protein MF4640_12755 [Acinetobacter sp. MF4640]
MRKDSIYELLEDVKETFLLISGYKKIPPPKVKTMLEHLRSCLEYAAQDINSKLSAPKVRFYFPYGKNLETLVDSTQKNLPLLQAERPDIFAEIIKLHNFESDGEWLKSLCDMTNHTKHKNAIDIKSDHEKVKSVMITAGGMNLLHACGESSNITFTNCSVNGQKLDDFVVNKGEVNITKKGTVPINFKITKDRKILVGDEEIDLLPFLDSSIKNIESFIDQLYEIL